MISFDLPVSVKRELEKYARTENISPAEAAVKFIQSGLKASKRKASDEVREEDLEALRRNVPFYGFLEKLPESSAEDAESEAGRSARKN